jgi:hypothetical protein
VGGITTGGGVVVGGGVTAVLSFGTSAVELEDICIIEINRIKNEMINLTFIVFIYKFFLIYINNIEKSASS